MVDIANFEYPLFNCWARHCIAAVPERERERPRQGRLRVVGIRCGLTPTCAGAGRERPRRPRQQQQFGTTATARRPQPSRPTDIPCFKSLGSPRASCGAGSRGECNASTDYGPRLEPAGLLPAACWVAAPARSGEASPENDLGRTFTIKFLHDQSETPRLAARLQAPAPAAHGICCRHRRAPRWGC